MLNFVVTALVSIIILLILAPIIYLIYIFKLDKKQSQHAILRNFPILGRVRYISEKVGPEFRQYLFDADSEGKPFSRIDYQTMVKMGKYQKDIQSFGGKIDYDKEGWFLSNDFIPKEMSEVEADNEVIVETKHYVIDNDGLFNRKEHIASEKSKPWLLSDKDAVVIGPKCKHPFVLKSLVGMSGMSYGSLGENAISALSHGLSLSRGTWMDTGEGGLSEYHLSGGVDIIMQIGPANFGVRDKGGRIDWEELKKKAAIPNVKAFSIKLGQGAKIKGGILPASKVSPKIAETRGVEPYQDVYSPNRNPMFDDVPSLVNFIEKIREVTGKPVGVKMVMGSPSTAEKLAQYMKETGKGPDFIQIDGGEGGSGAHPASMTQMGLPIAPGLINLDITLRKYQVRDRVKIIASGKLNKADKVAIALGLGADLVAIARGYMIQVGCIMAQHCSTNGCPVGVATTNPELQEGLVVDEKKYRVVNYTHSLRHDLFALAAASGLKTPAAFSYSHVVYQDSDGKVKTLQDLYPEHY